MLKRNHSTIHSSASLFSNRNLIHSVNSEGKHSVSICACAMQSLYCELYNRTMKQNICYPHIS